MTDLATFLANFRPGGYVNFCAIVPDRSPTGRSFNGCQRAETWLRAQNRRANVYFTFNRTPDNFAGKPSKEKITAIVGMHAEIDPRENVDLQIERARLIGLAGELMALASPPSILIDSGSGLQVAWLLADPIAVTPEYVDAIESINRRIGAVLGADPAAWNVDRLLRVPGTVNYPNAKKRKLGRPQCEAKIVHADWGRRYLWRDLEAVAAALEASPPKHAAPVAPKPKPNGAKRPRASAEMPEPASAEMVEQLLSAHPGLRAIWDRTKPTDGRADTSDSGWDSSLAAALARLGYGEDAVKSFIAAYRAEWGAKPAGAGYYHRTATRQAAFVAAQQNQTMAQIMNAWMRQEFAPNHRSRDRAAFWSNSWERYLLPKDISSNTTVLELMAEASDAPRNKHNVVSHVMLPGHFLQFRAPVFSDIVETLPCEQEAPVSPSAKTYFARMLSELLHIEIDLGKRTIKGRVVETEVERRSIGQWALRFGKDVTDWKNLRGKACWTKDGPSFAFRPELINQVKGPRDLGAMSGDTLAKIVTMYGLGEAVTLAGRIVPALSTAFLNATGACTDDRDES